MKRTTVMIEEETLYNLKAIAQRENASMSHIIREALVEYVVERTDEESPLMNLAGIFSSSDDDLSERYKSVLREAVHPQYGFGIPPEEQIISGDVLEE